MAKLQPFNHKSSRADEIIRQCAARNLAKKEAQKEAKRYLYYGNNDSWKGGYEYSNFGGSRRVVEYWLNHISLEHAKYTIKGMNVPLGNSQWLVPCVTIDWSGRYEWMMGISLTNIPRILDYFIYLVDSDTEPTENLLRYPKDKVKLIGCNNTTYPDYYKGFLQWRDHIDSLASLGFCCAPNIDRHLISHVQKYFKINRVKSVIHEYAFTGQCDQINEKVVLSRMKGCVDQFTAVESVKFSRDEKVVYANFSYLAWVEKDENGEFQEIYRTKNIVLSMAMLSEFNRTQPLSEREGWMIPSLHITKQEAEWERIREKNRQDDEYDYIPNKYFYNFNVITAGEECNYLLSDGQFWHKVWIPDDGDHHLTFPPVGKEGVVDFYTGKNWNGVYDIDFYHAFYRRSLPLELIARNRDRVQGIQYGDDIFDYDSTIISKAYKEQLRKECDPDYVPSGVGFGQAVIQ